jgi:hypothetical protein
VTWSLVAQIVVLTWSTALAISFTISTSRLPKK